LGIDPIEDVLEALGSVAQRRGFLLSLATCPTCLSKWPS
jgi:hypothetical protein